MTTPLERANQELAAAQADRAALRGAQADVDTRVAKAAKARHDAIGAPALGSILPIKAGEPGKYAFNWIGIRVETRGIDPAQPDRWRVSGTLYQVDEWGNPQYRWVPMGNREATLTQSEFDRLPEAVRQATAQSVIEHVHRTAPPKRRWFRR